MRNSLQLEKRGKYAEAHTRHISEDLETHNLL